MCSPAASGSLTSTTSSSLRGTGSGMVSSHCPLTLLLFRYGACNGCRVACHGSRSSVLGAGGAVEQRLCRAGPVAAGPEPGCPHRQLTQGGWGGGDRWPDTKDLQYVCSWYWGSPAVIGPLPPLCSPAVVCGKLPLVFEARASPNPAPRWHPLGGTSRSALGPYCSSEIAPAHTRSATVPGHLKWMRSSADKLAFISQLGSTCATTGGGA